MRERRSRSSPESDITLQDDEDEHDVEDGHERHEEQAQPCNLTGRDVSDHPHRDENADDSPSSILRRQRQQNPEGGVRDPPADERSPDHQITTASASL